VQNGLKPFKQLIYYGQEKIGVSKNAEFLVDVKASEEASYKHIVVGLANKED
jgi:hypothetical protein